MNVQLLLDKPRNHFTNLDLITGKVVLRTRSQEDVQNITVKLEGESKTRLIHQVASYNQRHERPRPVLEVHKMLYKVFEVWPQQQQQQQLPGRDAQSFVTLPPGLYEYPFSFKIPFNNACSTVNSLRTNTGFSGLNLEIGENPRHHVKTTLPPTLYFPGEAQIHYYVKVTVRRRSFFKENARAVVPFNFFPIEPPRPITDGETYARRQHQFQMRSASVSSIGGNLSKRGTFSRLLEKSSTTQTSPTSPAPSNDTPTEPPRFAVDARLPNPSVATCNHDLPLRVLVKRLSACDQPVYLQTLQIELIGYTHVRAHAVARKESTSWVIISLANIAQPIGSITDPVDTETELDAGMWKGRILPSTVAPTFATCNLKRDYELLVTVGLAYGSDKGSQSQFASLPLRLPLKVFSGIKPPAALLEAMHLPPGKQPLQSDQESAAPTYEPTPMVPGQSYLADAPAGPSASSGPSQAHGGPPMYEDAPPSYEDAIAADLPPVDGPRPDYEPPPAPEGEGDLTHKDEKRRLPF